MSWLYLQSSIKSFFSLIFCTFHFWLDIECKITRMQLLLCFNLVIETIRHLPDYHFCHKNLVQSIDVLPSSGIHRQRFASTFWLQKEKKINIWQRTQLQVKPTTTYVSGHNAPVHFYWHWAVLSIRFEVSGYLGKAPARG